MDRVKFLKWVSGLDVFSRKEKSQTVYTFRRGKHVLKSMFTYSKAKAFAEGVAIGKKLIENQTR